MKTALLFFALAAPLAQAHVTLEEPRAAAGAGYKAVLRVGHGCEGSATQTLAVRMPAGFRRAKPMPKPGWDLTIRRSPAAGDDVVEIVWQAHGPGNVLPDAQYDEFVLRGQAPEQVGPTAFQVLQVCEKGQADWSAPLDVLPANAAAHVH